MWKVWEVQYVPQGDLILGENSPEFELCDANCYIMLYIIPTMVTICHINGMTARITQKDDE